jgi:hypothetical protein
MQLSFIFGDGTGYHPYHMSYNFAELQSTVPQSMLDVTGISQRIH